MEILVDYPESSTPITNLDILLKSSLVCRISLSLCLCLCPSVLVSLCLSVSDTRPFLSRRYTLMFLSGGVCSRWLNWGFSLTCVNNDEALLSKLAIRSASDNSTRVHMMWWHGVVDRRSRTLFFHTPVIRTLCKLLEGFMDRILHGKFFVMEVFSMCSKVFPSLNRKKHYLFLCWIGIMWIVIWTTQVKGSIKVSLSHLKHW